MGETLIEKLTKTREGMRLYQQERVILEFTELICDVMEQKGVLKSELAKRLGRSKGYITQLLDGRANMTLRTISDVLTALEESLHISSSPLSTGWGTAEREVSHTIEGAWDPSGKLDTIRFTDYVAPEGYSKTASEASSHQLVGMEDQGKRLAL